MLSFHKEDALIIDNVSKSYKKGSVLANDSISTYFAPSQITALIGHNGAGKTTLLNQICGNVKSDSGDIFYNGNTLGNNCALARQLVSTMPQFLAPLAGVTLRQSIESILLIRGMSKKDMKSYTDNIIRDLQIEKWEKFSGDKLSGGLQRLTSFAMAVTFPSPIILLDEPTNDVDPVRRKLIWNYMRKLANNGHVIIVVTHNLLEVEEYADRYVMLEKGKVIKEATLNMQRDDSLNNVLTIALHNNTEISTWAENIKIHFSNDNKHATILLDKEQTLVAVEWVEKNIIEGKIKSYKLESNSLNASYGGIING